MKRNRNAGYTEINKDALGNNRNTGDSEIKERINSANKVMSDVSFLYQRIIIYNEQKKKKIQL